MTMWLSKRALARSFDEADQELTDGVRTGQAGDPGSLYDNPVHAVVFLQAKKVIAVECFPAFLSVELIRPRRGQCREHTGGATILHGLGERTALRDCAETMLIFPRQSHIAGI